MTDPLVLSTLVAARAADLRAEADAARLAALARCCREAPLRATARHLVRLLGRRLRPGVSRPVQAGAVVPCCA